MEQKNLTSKALTVLLLSATVIFLAFNLEPSGTPNIWRYSYLKLLFLAAVLGAIGYLAWSLWAPRLRAFNLYVLYGVVFNLIFLEVLFRVFPALVPNQFLPLLQADVRSHVADQRGLFTNSKFSGEGMLYWFRPSSRPLKEHPWISVDGDGFRNPGVPKGETDVVFFGDSVVFARHAEKDFGGQLRDRGIDAYSLAMGGNGLYHYRDAYRKYVIERNLAHKRVVIFLSLQTDFYEAVKYTKVTQTGGDYRDFLGVSTTIGPTWPDRQPSLVVAIAARLAALMRLNLSDFSVSLSGSLGDTASVELPYGSYPVTPGFLEIPDVTKDGELWRAFKAASADIIDDASGFGVHVTFVVLPGPALLYRNYVSGLNAHKVVLDRRYRNLVTLLRNDLEPQDVRVIDLVDEMATAIGSEILAANPLDYHFNTRGWEVLTNRLAPQLDAAQ